MKKTAYFAAILVVSLSAATASASAQSFVSGTNPRPQFVSGTNPRPQFVSGTNPRPQAATPVSAPTSFFGTWLSALMSMFGR